MSYIIKRTDQGGGYVAREGSASSYVKSPSLARRFPSYREADANRCPGNEVILEYFPERISNTAGE